MAKKQLDPGTIERLLIEQGIAALKAFHEEYEKNPTDRDTEFYRGTFIGWHKFYGDDASDIIQHVRDTAKLTIPHAGPLTPNGKGHIGWDSDADTFIDKLE